MKNVFALPSVVTDYELFPNLDKLSIVVPEECTNLCTNPSGEIDILDWVFTLAVQPDHTQSYRGAGCFFGTASGAGEMAYYPNLVTESGKYYTVSLRVRGNDGDPANRRPISVFLGDASRVQIGPKVLVTPTMDWQYISFTYYEEFGWIDRTLVIYEEDALGGNVFFDCVQIEQNDHATTYCDGEQPGCIWLGYPHRSKSFRSAQSRFGGRLVSFESLGFQITSLVGLGSNPVQHRIQSLANGADIYQDSVITNRNFTLVGQMNGRTYFETRRKIAELINQLKIDRTSPQEPLWLVYDPQKIHSSPIWIPCLYVSGLEGSIDSLHAEKFAIQFHTLGQMVREQQGFAYFTSTYRSDPIDGITVVDKNGNMSALNVSLGGAALVLACCFGADGKLYIGGDFTNVDGVSDTKGIARYNFVTHQWESICTDGTSRKVHVIIKGPGSLLLFGGEFPSINGVSNTGLVAGYDPLVATWYGSANDLLTPSTVVYDLTIFITNDTNGGLPYLVAATDDGVYYQPVLNVWIQSGFPTGGHPTTVSAGAVPGHYFAAGTFTDMNGVANTAHIAEFDSFVWTPLLTGLSNSPHGRMRLTRGILYFDDNFVIRAWDGSSFTNLFSFSSGDVQGIFIRSNGQLLTYGETSLPFNGGSLVVVWNGITTEPLGSYFFLPSGGSHVYDIAENEDEMLAFVSSNSLNIDWVIPQELNNGGTIPSPVVFRFVLATGAGYTGTGPVIAIMNFTTGGDVKFKNFGVPYHDFNYLKISPSHYSFESSLRGNMSPRIVPGSIPISLLVPPGKSILAILAINSYVNQAAIFDQAVWGIDE